MDDNPSVVFEGETFYANCDHENEVPLEKKQQLFHLFIKTYSTDKKNALNEWRCIGDKQNEYDDVVRCICSKRIRNWNLIENTVNGQVFIIGSDCVNRHLKNAVRCKKCSRSLKNIVKRLNDHDLLCRKCKRSQKERQAQLAHLQVFLFDRFYKFWQLLNDMELMTAACNMPTEFAHEKRLYAHWEEYLKLHGWEIYELLPEEVEC